jgi:signal transduction histidine kinase
MQVTVTDVSAEQAAQAAQYMDALRQGKSWAGEFEVRCKDGTLRSALVNLSPVRDETGEVTRIVGISQDLSKRKQEELQLREAGEELDRRVRERTAELDRANQSLRELSARLLQLRDQEARRLARELHDSVGQLLVAISLNIAKVRSQSDRLDEDIASAVAENALMIEQVTREIRTISHLLHPPLLEEVGLASALRGYVDVFSNRSNIRVDLEVGNDLGRLGSDMEITIFRIVQECLTNIYRHSGSRSARIQIWRQDFKTRVVVVAQDAGKGIPREKLQVVSQGGGGVGFRGMAERVRHLGGTLDIQSGSGGTTITASLPIEQETEINRLTGT